MTSVYRISILLLLTGCATHRPVGPNPNQLLEQACRPGSALTTASGSVWLVLKSKEASGQFPALVVASPDKLNMEATNLTGGTQAKITVEGATYKIEMASKKQKDLEGQDHWGGIPLRWAPDLFLGRIPCPSAKQRDSARMTVSATDELSVETPEDLFVYQLKDWAGAKWPTQLHWESRVTKDVKVDFSFSDPEATSNSPKKWTARSEQGEIKVRWRDRKTQSEP